MNKYGVLVAMALCVGFAACEDEKEEFKGAVSIVSASGELVVAQLDTLSLSADVVNKATDAKYIWTVNNQPVATTPTYRFTQAKAADYLIGVSVTGANGELLKSETAVTVKGAFGDGTFVLNEGNMGNETGTLTFINARGELKDSVYYRVNGELLGNVSQDLFITAGKIYIISQNGAKSGGSGRLIIADAKTLKKIKVYDSELAELSMTSQVGVVGDDIYIRHSGGIRVLNAVTGKLGAVDGVAATKMNRMAVIGDKVFVMDNANNILVLQNKKLVHTIVAGGEPSGLAKSSDGQLWVSCIRPNKIMKINVSDYSVIGAHELSEDISAGWGVAPAFSAKGDTIYFSNAKLMLNRHIFGENKTEQVLSEEELKQAVPDAGVYYNSLGVNPVTGEVIMATLKAYGQYKTNDIAVFDFSKTPALQKDFKGKNSFPAGVYFTANFK